MNCTCVKVERVLRGAPTTIFRPGCPVHDKDEIIASLRDQLEAAKRVMTYADHKPLCIHKTAGYGCTCGLTDLLEVMRGG